MGVSSQHDHAERLHLQQNSPTAAQDDHLRTGDAARAETEILELLAKPLLCVEDISQLQEAAKRSGPAPHVAPENNPTVVFVPGTSPEHPASKLFAEISNSEQYRAGPRIDTKAIARLSVAKPISLDSIARSFRALGRDAVAFVVPKGAAEDSYEWLLYVRT